MKAMMRIATIVILFCCPPALAQTAGMLSFQGLLKDADGVPVSGSVTLQFRIYDAQTGGNLVDMDGDGTLEDVVGQDAKEVLATATNGVVSTKFGPVSPKAFNGNARWLAVHVDGTALSRTEMAMAPATAEQMNLPDSGTALLEADPNASGGVGVRVLRALVPIVRLGARSEGHGLMQFYEGDGDYAGAIGASSIGGGFIQLKAPNDAHHTFTVFPTGESAELSLFGSAGLQTIRIDGNDSSLIELLDGNGDKAIHLWSDEDGTGHRNAEIALYNSVHTNAAIAIDADDGNGDAWMYFKNRQGETTVTIKASEYDGPGTVVTQVLKVTGGSDLAEPFAVSESQKTREKIEPGMVVVIDPDNPGQLKLAREPYDRKVAGVISGANGLQPGMVMTAAGSPATRPAGDGSSSGDHPVALTGRVYVWADATFGAIEPGDMLTTSATPGHAMRADEKRDFPRGCIIGKAMSKLEKGKGLVLVLVQPQ